MHRVGAWVEGEAAWAFLRRLNLPFRRLSGPADPAFAEVEALALEATLPRPRFSGPVFLLGEGGRPLDDAEAARLLRLLAPHYLPFFKTLVENVRDIVYVVDEEGRAHYANPQVRSLGYRPPWPGSPEDLTRFLEGEDRRHAAAALAALLAAPGKTLTFHFRARDAEGRLRALRVWGKNLRHRPEVGGILLNVRDVGEEARLREALAEEAARLKALVEALPGVAFQARIAPGEDPREAPSLFQSPQATAVLGFPPEAFLEDPGFYYRQVHPDDRDALVELARRALREPGQSHRLSYRFRHGKTGAWVWLRDTLRYDGQTRLLTGFTEDVTRERETEARFRTLAETAPAVILMWQGERLVFANRAAIEIGGYGEDELRSRPIWDFVHPDDRAKVRAYALARLAGRPAPARYPFRIVAKKGEVRWLDYSAATVEIGGAPAVLGVGLDVTEAKEHELDLELFARLSRALRQSEEPGAMLEAALSVLTEFFRAEAGALVLYQEGRAWAMARRGWMAEIPVAPALEDQSLVAAAIKEGQTLVLEEVKRDPRLRPAARPYVPEGWSQVVAPLVAGRNRVGALLLARPGPPPLPPVVRRLGLAAETVGNAVQRAALRARLEQRVRDLEVLAEVGRVVAAGPGVEETANAVFRGLARLPFAGAALWTWEGGRPRLAAAWGRAQDPGLEAAAAGSAWLLRVREAAGPLIFCLEGGGDPLARWGRGRGLGALSLYPLRAHGVLLGALALLAEEEPGLSPEDRSFLATLVAQLEVALDNARRFAELAAARAELADAYEKTLWGWAKAVELRDRETAGHTERVADLAVRLGRALGLSRHDLEDLRRGAILHDVGKLAIPDAILLKPGELDPEEWAAMKRHPLHAYDWLRGIPFLARALEVVRYHHERWDGSGYPEGLKGEAIPLLARIFAVADVFDALTSDRPYRRAWSRERALAHLAENAGRLFDPAVVAALLRFAERGEV